MVRTTCAGCDHPVMSVLELGTSPLADEFPTDPSGSQQRYPLGLQHCPACTMIQLSYVVPDDILWGGDYGFYTGGSPAAVDYFVNYAKDVFRNYGAAAKRGVLEIACNDGTLLQHFDQAGFRTMGVDPAAGPANAARRKNLDVLPVGFTAELAGKIAEECGRFGLVIANNVIAHTADIIDFAVGLAAVLDEDGVALVEFQYAPDLIFGNAIDHVYHEHRSYLTLTALQCVLARVGLTAVSAVHNQQQRGSLRVTVKRHHVGGHGDHSVRDLLRAEQWLLREGALDGLQPAADRLRTLLTQALMAAKMRGEQVAGYGASAKATTLLSWCGIQTPDLVRYVVDTTPEKIGRYMPGTSIPIVSPTADSRRPDMYLMLISNYLGHVLNREHLFTARGGRFLVPIPYPAVI